MAACFTTFATFFAPLYGVVSLLGGPRTSLVLSPACFVRLSSRLLCRRLVGLPFCLGVFGLGCASLSGAVSPPVPVWHAALALTRSSMPCGRVRCTLSVFGSFGLRSLMRAFRSSPAAFRTPWSLASGAVASHRSGATCRPPLWKLFSSLSLLQRNPRLVSWLFVKVLVKRLFRLLLLLSFLVSKWPGAARTRPLLS